MSQPDFWARAVALVNEWQRRTGGIMAGREMEELRCALADAYFDGQESARASPSPETRTAAAPETRTGEGAGPLCGYCRHRHAAGIRCREGGCECLGMDGKGAP